MTAAKFSPGRNIAMKVPPHQYGATVTFYRDVLGFEQLQQHLPSVVFKFGDKQLWIDRVATMTQAELWLDVVTNDLEAAAAHLQAANVVRCDDVEPLPEGLRAFWIASPAGIVHLVDSTPVS